MKNTIIAFAFGTAAALLHSVAQAQDIVPTHPAEGVWLTESQTEVTIAPCPEGLCGRISKIVIPPEVIEKYGEEAIASLEGNYFDANNEDPSLRSRPIMGLQILTLNAVAEGGRYNGIVYNPQDGKTYSGFLEVPGNGIVRLSGCGPLGVVCVGQRLVQGRGTIRYCYGRGGKIAFRFHTVI